ncbi:hypothetical protein F4778DRAFT_526085 [Xylariomycetidae sp. FL2044]|nr:hypothetical protein F4778DRAFT_526085 [Xylariomycetidae sp. FL2044]
MEMTDYTNWTRMSSQLLTQPKRMSKETLERWVHRHLLKILLPYPRDKDGMDYVCTPLNPTAILRLVAHLHTVGYPAHWLDSILGAMFQGELKGTTARAPRKEVDDPTSVAEVFPRRDISITPWAAEISTLGSLWVCSGLLPFGLSMGHELLPSLSELKKYSLVLPFPLNALLASAKRPTFILVFWDKTVAGKPPVSNKLRKILLDDEGGDKGTNEKGVMLVTTFKWVTKKREASFWMRRDAVETILNKHWQVALWRSDSWEPVTKWVEVGERMTAGEQWLSDGPQGRQDIYIYIFAARMVLVRPGIPRQKRGAGLSIL